LMEILRKDLTKRELQVIIMRFGLDRAGTRSLSEVAEEVDMTREGVRVAEKRAFSKLNKELLAILIKS